MSGNISLEGGRAAAAFTASCCYFYFVHEAVSRTSATSEFPTKQQGDGRWCEAERSFTPVGCTRDGARGKTIMVPSAFGSY